MTQSHGDETDPKEESPQYLSFTNVLAQTGRLYALRWKPLAVLFALASIAITLLSLVGLASPGRLELFLAFAAQIVLPVIIGSFAMALASVMYADRSGEPVGVRDAWGRVRPRSRDILFSGLFASMLALWAVILLRQFGFVLMPLFFGPPIAIQVIALEGLDFRPARSRSRELLKGQTGRVVVYLVVVALAVGLLGTATLSATVAVLDPALDGATLAGVFSIVQVLVAALMLPFLAGAAYVCYRTLVATQPEAT